MDGRGAWRDNIFVERLWRSVKYEEVYLNAYESMAEAKSGIGNFRRENSGNNLTLIGALCSHNFENMAIAPCKPSNEYCRYLFVP